MHNVKWELIMIKNFVIKLSKINFELFTKNIKHKTTISRALEQNKFIERQNRTIIESIKSMLHTKKLSLYL